MAHKHPCCKKRPARRPARKTYKVSTRKGGKGRWKSKRAKKGDFGGIWDSLI